MVSLFTNTPINKSLEVIKERLTTDNACKDRTKLLVEDVMELLEFILTMTYFVFRDQIYCQEFGTAMGSPVSPYLTLPSGWMSPVGRTSSAKATRWAHCASLISQRLKKSRAGFGKLQE